MKKESNSIKKYVESLENSVLNENEYSLMLIGTSLTELMSKPKGNNCSCNGNNCRCNGDNNCNCNFNSSCG